MSDVVARLSALASVAIAIAAGVFVYVNSQPGLDGTTVRAEFTDAYPLLEGMHVRQYGAVAGTVAEIEVTDRGTVEITLALNEGTDPPRKDATATIRQEDITGDSYVALSPGDDPEPLGDETIPTTRTMSAPRFDDLLNSFSAPVRKGLELTLVELGMALESRGADLNEAALRLRPAIEATNEALEQIGDQSAAIRDLIADARKVTAQAADRKVELGRLVDNLARSLDSVARRSGELDTALENSPEALAATRGTLRRLADVAEEGVPLARSLERISPELAQFANLLGPFLDDTEAILGDVMPTLDLTVDLLLASEPTLRANPKRIITAPFDVASGIATVLDTLIGDPDLIRGIFGADTYGGTQPGNFEDDVGFGSFVVESGKQQNYPADYDPLRRFARASTVPSCEMFGQPISPGCLGAALSTTRALARSERRGDGTPKRAGEGAAGERSTGPGAKGEGGRPLKDLVGGVRETVRGVLDELGVSQNGSAPERAKSGRAVGDLLDFLLGS